MRSLHPTAVLVLYSLLGIMFMSAQPHSDTKSAATADALHRKFDYLSQHGNSSCSRDFQASIPGMPDTERIQGSCCSPMSFHEYREQVQGLEKYAAVPEVPPDPYDIQVSTAKRLLQYYRTELSAKEQQAYDEAMAESHERGPCCCKCWRWYVYGGLGKLLIRDYGFSGKQLTDVWNLSDGCGGDEQHHH